MEIPARVQVTHGVNRMLMQSGAYGTRFDFGTGAWKSGLGTVSSTSYLLAAGANVAPDSLLGAR